MKPLWRTSWQFMVELKTFIPYEPAVYSLEKHLYLCTRIGTSMYIAALVVIRKTGNIQQGCE